MGAGPQTIRIRQTLIQIPWLQVVSPAARGCLLLHSKLTRPLAGAFERSSVTPVRLQAPARTLPLNERIRTQSLFGSRSVEADRASNANLPSGARSWWPLQSDDCRGGTDRELLGSALLSLQDCASRSGWDWPPQAAAQTARLRRVLRPAGPLVAGEAIDVQPPLPLDRWGFVRSSGRHPPAGRAARMVAQAISHRGDRHDQPVFKADGTAPPAGPWLQGLLESIHHAGIAGGRIASQVLHRQGVDLQSLATGQLGAGGHNTTGVRSR